MDLINKIFAYIHATEDHMVLRSDSLNSKAYYSWLEWSFEDKLYRVKSYLDIFEQFYQEFGLLLSFVESLPQVLLDNDDRELKYSRFLLEWA